MACAGKVAQRLRLVDPAAADAFVARLQQSIVDGSFDRHTWLTRIIARFADKQMFEDLPCLGHHNAGPEEHAEHAEPAHTHPLGSPLALPVGATVIDLLRETMPSQRRLLRSATLNDELGIS